MQPRKLPVDNTSGTALAVRVGAATGNTNTAPDVTSRQQQQRQQLYPHHQQLNNNDHALTGCSRVDPHYINPLLYSFPSLVGEAPPCRYSPRRVIGRGAFSTVWMLVELSSGAAVVGKLSDLAQMTESNGAFARAEAANIRACCHPNIIRLIDTFEERRRLLHILEYADGGDLLTQVEMRARRVGVHHHHHHHGNTSNQHSSNDDNTTTATTCGAGPAANAHTATAATATSSIVGDRGSNLPSPSSSSSAAAAAASGSPRPRPTSGSGSPSSPSPQSSHHRHNSDTRGSAATATTATTATTAPVPAPAPVANQHGQQQQPQQQQQQQVGSSSSSSPFHYQEPEVLVILAQLCLAMEYLHTNKIMHRDLKTSNVMLMRSGLIKLGDFGFSRQYEESVSADVGTTFCGTPYYLAPELWQRRPYSYKADIWSLGVIFYEILTLRKPFPATDLNELMNRVLREHSFEPLPADRYSPQLISLVKRMLTVDPARRPSVREILYEPIAAEGLNLLACNVGRLRNVDPMVSQGIVLHIARIRADAEEWRLRSGGLVATPAGAAASIDE